jgi:hypothetical protein
MKELHTNSNFKEESPSTIIYLFFLVELHQRYYVFHIIHLNHKTIYGAIEGTQHALSGFIQGYGCGLGDN